jgi:hypothetical protein
MTKKEFNQKLSEMCAYVKQHKCDDMREQLKPFAEKYGGLHGACVYGMWCEKNFERNLREDYKRITTYTSDFSIAEWCVPIDGMNAIADTMRNALMNWRDNVEWFTEIMLVVNMKSWEHAARHNNNYGRMYSDLYYMVRDLYFDWFDESHPKHAEAIEYYYDYVD